MIKTISNAGDLNGVFPALFTPLNRDDPKCLRNSIDYEKAQKIMDSLIEVGVHGLVPVGTTGQSATLSATQHVDFIKFVLDYAGDRIPIIAGAGSNCTRESIDTINAIQAVAGEIAFLCVTGYYNTPPQEGIISHYEALGAETGAKIVIYNVPSRTNSYITAETLITLSKNPNIIGLKQAVDFTPGGSHRVETEKIFSHTKNSEFSVVSGEDDAFYHVLELGGNGIITATGNIPEAAALFCKLYQAFREGDKESAMGYQKALACFIEICFSFKNPIPLAALFQSPVFKPLVSIEDTMDGVNKIQIFREFVQTSAPSLLPFWTQS